MIMPAGPMASWKRPGAATEINYGVARLKIEGGDGMPAVGLNTKPDQVVQARRKIVTLGAFAVGRNDRLSILGNHFILLHPFDARFGLMLIGCGGRGSTRVGEPGCGLRQFRL